jgi:GDP/UDP-N,N'-diacetylbacillosamine 2-epimerase (hydrolysing)
MRIAVLTSSRADFGIYLPLLKKLESDPFFQLELIVFGTHLSQSHGYTLNEIEASGFKVKYKLETLPEGDSAEAIAAAVATGFSKFGSFWSKHNASFDLVFCLGDRFEMFAAVLSAVPFNMKFAHIHGGEKTLGAIDNIYRHAISHASVLHFASTDVYAQRLKEMLDDTAHIYNSGSLSLDNLSEMQLYSIEEFKEKWQVDLDKKPVLVTFHPETVQPEKNKFYANELSSFIAELNHDVVITMPNADTAGNEVRKIFEEKLGGLKHVKMIENFGTRGYFTILHHCLFVAGNSSSGIIEAASFGKYVLNIGDRQKGRLQSGNVVNTEINKTEMQKASREIISKGQYKGKNRYQSKGVVADYMIDILKDFQKEHTK